MFKTLRFFIAALFLFATGMQGYSQIANTSHKCNSCQTYTEEQLQQMRESYQPHVGVSNQRMPDSFKNIQPFNARQDLSNQGTDFWLAFMKNYDNAGLNLYLDITSNVNTTGMITIDGIGFSQNYSVTANTVTRVNIPLDAIVNNSQTIESLGIHVVADDPVTVYGTNQILYTTDSFLGLPVSILGTQYLTMNYYGPSTTETNASEFVIVSPYDNNTVTITPSQNTWSGNSAGVPFQVTLNQGETYLVRGAAVDNDDLTGTILESTLPVSLFSGSACSNVPSDFGYCDHLVQQIPPISTWGETFVTRPLEGRNDGDTWRFLSSQNNTQLSINGSNVATLDFGDYYETILDASSYVEASNPILAVQFSNGNTWDGANYPGDPFMMIIPPYQQFLDGYTFSTPGAAFVDNYFNSSVENDGIPGMVLDGSPLNSANYASIASTSFSAGAFPININTTYNLGNTDGYPSGLYVYGFNTDDSYGYPGGLSLVIINAGSGPSIELASSTLELFCVSNASTADLTISATITDDEEPFVQSATLFYRTIGETSYNSMAMTDMGGDLWEATVTSDATEFPGMEYYISATDGQVSNTSPATDPINNPYSIGVDNMPPDIMHTPVTMAQPGDDILISADVTDNTDNVASVDLFYRVQGGTPFYTMMNMGNMGGDTYEASIPGSAMTTAGLEYYIRATDNYGASCTFASADDPSPIDAGSMENIPPVPVGFPMGTVSIDVGNTWNLSVQFESPEDGQTTDVVVNGGGFTGFSYLVSPGNVANVDLELIASEDNLGMHTIEFVATDDGEPVESTTVELQLMVTNPLAGQVICIPEGWSAISSYNDPYNPDMEDIFASLVAEGKVEFVVNQDGIYWPSQNINQFTEGWDVKKGYKIKMNQEGCLGIDGEMPEDKSFTAMEGSGFVPVLCDQPVAATDVFSQFGDDMLDAFDIHDQLVYWPDGGIYTLATLEPGKGYLVTMINEGTASYNCEKGGTAISNQIPQAIENAPWNFEKTGSVHLISVSSNALQALEKDDIIGVFNEDGTCAGIAQYDGSDRNMLLVAYGDDLTTNVADGMNIAEQMNFRVFHAATQTEEAVAVQFDNGMPDAGYFEENGQSKILKITGSATSVFESKLDKINVHPNPGNGLFIIDIPSTDENIDVEVMNMAGQVIYSDVIGQNAGGYQLDLSGKSNGVFFVKFTTSSETIIRKVVVE